MDELLGSCGGGRVGWLIKVANSCLENSGQLVREDYGMERGIRAMRGAGADGWAVGVEGFEEAFVVEDEVACSVFGCYSGVKVFVGVGVVGVVANQSLV